MSSPTKVDSKPVKAKASKPKQAPQAEAKLKVVVRRLPANLPESIFWDSVLAWVNEDTCTWKSFVPGKMRKGLNKENVPSRAYIAFKTIDQLIQYSQDYDGHIFRDKLGNESAAVVEFAPFQKVPSEKKKVDQRAGTIQEDEDYLSFLASLGRSEPTESEKAAAAAASSPTEEPTTTPLLAALIAAKTASRDKEAILRNHAHYHGPDGASTPRKRIGQEQKETAEEALEFSRRAVPPDVVNRPPPEKQHSKPQSKPPGLGRGAEHEASGDQRKPRGPKVPPSPSRATKGKASQQTSHAGESISTSEASSSTSEALPRVRPKFKFDAAVAASGSRNQANPPNNRNGMSDGGSLASSVTEASGDGASPGLSRKQKQKAREKERAKEAEKSGAAPVAGTGDAAVARSPSSRGVARAPRGALSAAPKIMVRPAARIDDEETNGHPSSASSPAGIIPVQFSPRGRGRGNGRGAGRSRGGHGRGGTSSVPPDTA